MSEDVVQLFAADVGQDILEPIALFLPLKDRMSMAQVCTKWRAALLASEVAWSVETCMNVKDERAISDLRSWLAHRPGAKLPHLAIGPLLASCQETVTRLQYVLGPHAHTLTTLAVHACDLLGGPEFTALPSLSNLSLRFAVGLLRPDFARVTSLRQLTISSQSVVLEPGCLPPTLQSLTLQGTHIATPLAGILPPMTSFLTALSLQRVHFRTPGWGPLDAVWSMSSLQHLEIQGMACEQWPRGVSQLTALTHLSFEGTEVGVGGEPSVKTLNALRCLDLSNCRLTKLPKGTLALPRLHSLAIHANPGLVESSQLLWLIPQLELEIDQFALSFSPEWRVLHLMPEAARTEGIKTSASGNPKAIYFEDLRCSLWIVRGSRERCAQGTPIENGAIIKLQHAATRKFLHSHQFYSPLSNQQEVSCFGSDQDTDTGDEWEVQWDDKSKHWERDASVRNEAKLARNEFLSCIAKDDPSNSARISELIGILISPENRPPFNEKLLGNGPWQVVYTRGAFLWQVYTSPGKLVTGSSNRAAQDFNPSTRAVLNSGEIAGPSIQVSAVGSYTPTNSSTTLPKEIDVTITGGEINAWGKRIPLPIKGDGNFLSSTSMTLYECFAALMQKRKIVVGFYRDRNYFDLLTQL